MSFWGRRVSVKALIAATAVAVLLLGVLAVAVTRPAREITLVARGMAFYLENGDLPNPTITVKPGERVRIMLRNAASATTSPCRACVPP
jgi:FtsP/CotA-like multicopper oxidase with cupredoxin domain